MPIAPHFNDPQHWCQRAEESRVLAEQMSNETAKGDDAQDRGGLRQASSKSIGTPYRNGELHAMWETTCARH